MRQVAEQALIRARVRAVFADEGHRLMQGDGSHSVDEQLEWLKSLSNRTKVLHVLAGPYALFGFRNTSGQLARRGRDIHFARYHVENKEERIAFVAALKYLLERVPTVLPMPQVTPKPTKPRVGQRAPERDPVGNTPSPAQKSVGCSFTEVIPVTRAQAEEAGVSRFECPTCLAMRTITFTEGSVKFPWHPKRTTVTPHHGLHWVKREIWRLSDQ
jgi:hypothetical protein